MEKGESMKESVHNTMKSIIPTMEAMIEHLQPTQEEKDDQPIEELQEEDHLKVNEFDEEEDDLTTSEEGENEIQSLGVAMEEEDCSIEELILTQTLLDWWEEVEGFSPLESFEHFLHLLQSESINNLPTKESTIGNI
ncbi:unnamed protein product [Linum trigynum]|uniref:Uncharacterized protein n=1 Tax=Linum trigynum TaxID=586398 RepID=A0AAV2FLW1_9ROSI